MSTITFITLTNLVVISFTFFLKGHSDMKVKKMQAEINELRAKLEKEISEEKISNDEIKGIVYKELNDWVEAGHATIVSKVNGKEITTKIMRDEIAELEGKKRDLELALERANDVLLKVRGEE